jgi:hypothetical protein
VIAPAGLPARLRLIRDILAFAPGSAGEPPASARACQALAAVLKRRAVVFLVSDFQDRGCEAC